MTAPTPDDGIAKLKKLNALLTSGGGLPSEAAMDEARKICDDELNTLSDAVLLDVRARLMQLPDSRNQETGMIALIDGKLALRSIQSGGGPPSR